MRSFDRRSPTNEGLLVQNKRRKKMRGEKKRRKNGEKKEETKNERRVENFEVLQNA